MKFSYIRKKTGEFPVAWMCRRLRVSASGFYAWKKRPLCERGKEDERLRLKIRVYHRASRGCYGRPRIHHDLQEDGIRISQKRVARLMREQGIYGRPPKRWKKTTNSSHDRGYADNLVKQDFHASGPNRLWVSDISYVRTWEGWMYLAVVLDAYSRRVVGYAVEDHMRSELAVNALNTAIANRQPSDGLVHHSDRGSQYASHAYRAALKKIKAKASMSDTGSCYDNAMAESFFSTIKEELIYRNTWPSKSSVAREIRDYIDNFYNCRRRHSSIGNISPLEYEVGFMRRLAA